MQKLLTRGLSGVVYILLFLGAILSSEYTYLLLMIVFGSICIFEFSKIIDSKSLAGYILLPLLIYLIHERQDSSPVFIILLITVLSSAFLIYQLILKKAIQFRDERAKIGLMIRYVVFPITFLAFLPFFQNTYKPNLIISILVIIWVNDSFAFLVGKNIGKRKLFVSVSPKKTIEGFFGGLIFAIGSAFIVHYYNKDFSQLQWIVITLLVVLFGTLGDLIESKYKRQANIKDSGNIMPGHGGILDRLDSLMFAAPFVYLYLNYLI